MIRFGVFSRVVAFLMIIIMSPVLAEPVLSGAKLEEEFVYRTTFGRADDIKILLDKGANPNTKNPDGWSVLSIAADRTDPEAVKIVAALLEGGANPNAFDSVTKTYPIMNAVKNGSAEMVRYMIEKGADYKVKDANGRPLIEYAKIKGNQEVISLIQTKLDKEAQELAERQSPKRLRMLAERYAFSSCAYQYYVYYLDTKMDPKNDAATQMLITQYKKSILDTSTEIATYFPMLKDDFYTGIKQPAMSFVYNQLEKMVSNSARRKHGVGTSVDAEKRCKGVVSNIKITIPDKL